MWKNIWQSALRAPGGLYSRPFHSPRRLLYNNIPWHVSSIYLVRNCGVERGRRKSHKWLKSALKWLTVTAVGFTRCRCEKRSIGGERQWGTQDFRGGRRHMLFQQAEGLDIMKRGCLIAFCPHDGHLREQFIMFYLLQGHPRRHFCCFFFLEWLLLPASLQV